MVLKIIPILPKSFKITLKLETRFLFYKNQVANISHLVPV